MVENTKEIAENRLKRSMIITSSEKINIKTV